MRADGGDAGAPVGTTPSCSISDSMSATPQCSHTRPSASNRMMSMSWMSPAAPVDGIPMKSPRWVPVTLTRATALSPSATRSSTLMLRSGKAWSRARK